MTHRMIAIYVVTGRAVRDILQRIGLGVVAGLGLLFAADSVSADEQVEMSGSADPACAFTTGWSAVNAAGGASSGDFSGSAWTIPSSAFAAADGAAVQGPEYVLVIRADGSCNTSHTITVVSSRGGLSAVSDGSAPVAGFSNRRPMTYSAYWSDGANSSYGPASSQVRDFRPSNPGASETQTFIVSGAWPPPGDRGFELRLALERPSVAQPMVAGSYSDVVTVTLAVAP